MSRSTSGRRRPASAPPTRHRPSVHSQTESPILAPNLASVSILNVSRAELEAWATLTRNFESGPKERIASARRTRPMGVRKSRSTDVLCDTLETLGSAVRHPGQRRHDEDACDRAPPPTGSISERENRSPFVLDRCHQSDTLRSLDQDLDGCRAALTEHLADGRREDTGGRSGVSIRHALSWFGSCS